MKDKFVIAVVCLLVGLLIADNLRLRKVIGNIENRLEMIDSGVNALIEEGYKRK